MHFYRKLKITEFCLTIAFWIFRKISQIPKIEKFFFIIRGISMKYSENF